MGHALRKLPENTIVATPKPKLALVEPVSNYAELERPAPGVATTGIHPAVLAIVVSLYAALNLVFWATFVRDGETGLVLAVVGVLMIMYLGLIFGGIALADSPAKGETERSFAAFLSGKVQIATGAINGHEAMLQIVFLPVCMVALALSIAVRVALL